ncbi:MAG: hypothetical protein ACRDT6_13740 [Micromonosporaceae bacterium]
MPTTIAPEVLADPIGVVIDVVTRAGCTLDGTSLEGAVLRVAGGRAKRRRLAQALLDRPAVLTDGRSPAPRVVGELLVTLRAAGAAGVSAPVCAGCGKQLRTLQRRGEDWYCTSCSPRAKRCAVCGQERIVATLDRHGRPRCSQCPEADGRDPLLILTEVISALEPALPPEVVAAAIGCVFSKLGYLQRLAWAVEDRPELLTGAGAEAPMPGVLRLIDELRDAGAQTITRPACPRCQRIVRLHRRINEQWHCRNCVAKSRAQPCSRCGAIREAASRDAHGEPLCPNCFITDPANRETCIGCGRRRPVSTRTPDGPLCPTCRPDATMTCSICGRSRRTVISSATDKPWCHACRRRRARCTSCGNVRLVRGGTLTEPLCATCTRDTSFWHTCPGCGELTAHRRRDSCRRCTLQHRLQQLLRGDTGAVHPKLQALHDHLAHHEQPETVLSWLDNDTASVIVRELAAGQRPLTHAALDELPDGKPLQHLRSVLVAAGALSPRDEHLIRLEHWITSTIADRDDPDERQLLHRYAVWHVLRRLRHRVRDTGTTYGQLVAAKRNITAAIALLDALASRGQNLATAQQGDLEAWLTSTDTTSQADAGNFVRWANKHKLTALEFPAIRWRGPTGRIDTEARWQQARQLLHDDTLQPEDRAAGLLVLLYAQTAATISRLTLDHVETSNAETRLRLGREPVVLPEPIDTLVQQLVATRQGHATLGDQGTSRWLFPGGQPGHPITAAHLAKRLRQIGIQAGPARATALFQLATDLPAAVLARMLGIHISVAAAWQRAAAGDWTNYAAEVSRRNHR